MDVHKTKKTFNKKKWRNERYNKKFQKQQHEERRNKAIMRDYFKFKKHSGITTSNDVDETGQATVPGKVKRLKAYQQAQQEFEKRKQEKVQQKEEAAKRREEIKEAISKYNEKKKNKTQVLRKTTKRGQPVMKERLEMLYEKIKKSVETD